MKKRGSLGMFLGWIFVVALFLLLHSYCQNKKESNQSYSNYKTFENVDSINLIGL